MDKLSPPLLPRHHCLWTVLQAPPLSQFCSGFLSSAYPLNNRIFSLPLSLFYTLSLGIPIHAYSFSFNQYAGIPTHVSPAQIIYKSHGHLKGKLDQNWSHHLPPGSAPSSSFISLCKGSHYPPTLPEPMFEVLRLSPFHSPLTPKTSSRSVGSTPEHLWISCFLSLPTLCNLL